MAATAASGPSRVPTTASTHATSVTRTTERVGSPRWPSAKNWRMTTTNPRSGKPSNGTSQKADATSDASTGYVLRHARGRVEPTTKSSPSPGRAIGATATCTSPTTMKAPASAASRRVVRNRSRRPTS